LTKWQVGETAWHQHLFFLVRSAAEEETRGGPEPLEQGGRGLGDHEEELRAGVNVRKLSLLIADDGLK